MELRSTMQTLEAHKFGRRELIDDEEAAKWRTPKAKEWDIEQWKDLSLSLRGRRYTTSQKFAGLSFVTKLNVRMAGRSQTSLERHTSFDLYLGQEKI
jgi:hypothetical protein